MKKVTLSVVASVFLLSSLLVGCATISGDGQQPLSSNSQLVSPEICAKAEQIRLDRLALEAKKYQLMDEFLQMDIAKGVIGGRKVTEQEFLKAQQAIKAELSQVLADAKALEQRSTKLLAELQAKK